MSSVEYLRGFINERLTAAAEEIFGVFEKTIVQYEEEIDRQRRLLDITWKPEIKLRRIDLPQQHVCKEEEEEVVADQQLCIEERNSIVDQDDPESPQIKEEEEEVCSSQEGEQLEVKEETDDFMLIPSYEESDHSEDQSLKRSISESQNVVVEKPVEYISDKSSVSAEAKSDHQLLCHEAESQDQKGSNRDSGSTGDAELNQQNHNSNSHTNKVYNPTISTIQCNTHTAKKSFKCDTCGKAFTCKSDLKRHLRTHTGEKPHPCNICGKKFTQTSVLNAHIRIHTDERPYSCKTCGKDFRSRSHLIDHTRTHTGEKPYICKTCGRAFRLSGHLTGHMRTHTGEKPFICTTCGRAFRLSGHLIGHMRTHTGEKPFVCKTCGRAFRLSSHLIGHMRTHTGEKPYSCDMCGKRFCRTIELKTHLRIHAGDRSHIKATPVEKISDVTANC